MKPLQCIHIANASIIFTNKLEVIFLLNKNSELKSGISDA
jgi:hypothetical protein